MKTDEQQPDLVAASLAALDRYRSAQEALTEGAERPPAAGEVYVLEATGDFDVEWVILAHDPADASRFLLVPADCHVLAGSTDVELGDDSPAGPLTLRCRFATWTAAKLLRPELRVGVLGSEELARVRHRWLEVGDGEVTVDVLGREVDDDPGYQDWVRGVLVPARRALSEAQGVEEAPREVAAAVEESTDGATAGFGPTDENTNEVTRLLVALSEGDKEALGRLVPLVEGELRRIAEDYLAAEGGDHTLQPTVLINEVLLRLVMPERVVWHNRAQFLDFAAQSMKRILVDHARKRLVRIRNEDTRPLPVEEPRGIPVELDRELVALDDGLRILEKLDPRQSRAVELSHFAGQALPSNRALAGELAIPRERFPGLYQKLGQLTRCCQGKLSGAAVEIDAGRHHAGSPAGGHGG